MWIAVRMKGACTRPAGPAPDSAHRGPGGRDSADRGGLGRAAWPGAVGERVLMASPAVSGITVPARAPWILATACILLIVMLGGTLPVPLYVLYERQMGFGSLGVTMVFACYVVGTLFALIALGELSDHIGRRKVLRSRWPAWPRAPRCS